MNSFARIFKFRVLPGQQEAYDAYLRTVVTPIDEAARTVGVFERLVTIIPRGGADWNHGRIFIFRDEMQRGAFAERMAMAAQVFDGSEAARDARKAYAETLRALVAIEDYDIA